MCGYGPLSPKLTVSNYGKKHKSSPLPKTQFDERGFEKLARARGEGASLSLANQPADSITSDFNLNGIHAADNTSNNEDDFDMFADDDEKATVNPSNGTGPTQNDYVFDESSGTTTAAVWVIIMTHLQDFIAMQQFGTHITKKLGHMMSCKQQRKPRASGNK
ncbi:hypothetical protein QVD17_30410 [Tagetes erecta]|uniref:Uncharacterized protein n=1 Tax=Tagetes erecta TaxID=13708 RepID=A0AAD8NN84_TARER|nr:hypothetical protein QVD17_30410 [Tagetes erecta]